MTPTIELEYWQPRLGLESWAVTIRYGKVEPTNDAEIDYDIDDRTAAITVREGKRGDELSRLVLHELLHLVVAPLARIAKGRQREAIEESVVQHIEQIMGGLK